MKIEGVDKQADLLKGGIDGVYKLSSCYNDRPLYKRQKGNESRVLWYSNGFGDWDISLGTEPNEATIVMYGGEMQHPVVPLYVSGWHVGADLMSKSSLGVDDYTPVAVKVACADGKVYKAPKEDKELQPTGPVLTSDEIETKYRFIYEKYGRRPEVNPTVNMTFLVMLVFISLTIVLAIPYTLLRKKGGKPLPIATTFAQIIQQSKKKSSGHDS